MIEATRVAPVHFEVLVEFLMLPALQTELPRGVNFQSGTGNAVVRFISSITKIVRTSYRSTAAMSRL